MTFDATAKAELAKPLNSAHVKPPAPGKYGDYVEGWHVIAEANRIFGFDGWSRETIHNTECNRELHTLKGKNGEYQQWRVGYVAKVRVTAGGIVREGTGFGSGMGKPEAIGEAIESAIKEAETDAMKRALMTFGNPFGLALYDKTQANVSDEPLASTVQVSKYLDHFDAINTATDLDALQKAFLAAKADKSLTKQEADDLITAKDKRKTALTKPAVAPNFDKLQSEIIPPNGERQPGEYLRN
jgi:DNA repair and recombination protein RAD52